LAKILGRFIFQGLKQRDAPPAPAKPSLHQLFLAKVEFHLA
jgi:hypothetical protein